MRRLLLTAPLVLLGLPAFGGDPATSPTPSPATATTAPATATPATPAPAAPTTPAPAVTAVTMAAPDAAMVAYEARKLSRKPLDPMDGLYGATVRALPGSATPPWALYHGNGEVVTAVEFATSTGDTATSDRIARTHKHAKILQWSLTGAGVALVGLSVVPLLTMDRSIGDVGAEPVSTDFADIEAYTNALTLWRHDRGIEARNQNKVLTTAAIASTGVLVIASSPFAPMAANEREKVVPLFYSQQDADDRLLMFNIGVKKELGIIAPDPVEVVIPAAPPPPAPTPEDPDDGLEDGGGGPPVKPLDVAPLQVQPWLGFGFLGIQGTF